MTLVWMYDVYTDIILMNTNSIKEIYGNPK
nr:MAG TPA: hypothetical protein [Caudoviricetes sp.]DAY07926.1 MAG TPA: hypothetical protein [Caudoviricetes sp.]